MDNETYVLYLLKNYNRLNSEAQFMDWEAKIQQDYEKLEFDGVAGNVLEHAVNRFLGKKPNELKKAAEILRHELKMLDNGLDLLRDCEKGVLIDIYKNGLSWTGTAYKWYISESCISRYRERAAKKVGEFIKENKTKVSKPVLERFNKKHKRFHNVFEKVKRGVLSGKKKNDG